MPGLSYVADLVRRFDHDRYLTALLARPEHCEHLLALYAFNVEVARIPERVTEPLIGQMRLQWWRDTLDRLYAGEEVQHPVAAALGEAIAARRPDRGSFDRLLDGRELDLAGEAPADGDALAAYAEATGASLLAIAVRICGQKGESAAEAARLIGTAWALVGLLRAVPFHARYRRVYLPRDRLDAAGVRTSRLLDLKPDAALAGVVCDIAGEALAMLDQAAPLIRSIPRTDRAPLTLAILARLHLDDLRRVAWDPFALERKPRRPLAALHLAVRHWLGAY